MSVGQYPVTIRSMASIAGTEDHPNFPNPDEPEDEGETVIITPLALFKMMTHAKAGIPFEVMGNLMGRFLDEEHMLVTDAFPVPLSGNALAVDALDPIYTSAMVDMLQEIGVEDTQVGWYHGHPGYGCFLSPPAQRTQMDMQSTLRRAIAIVLDPVQSRHGNVVMDAFRVYNSSTGATGLAAIMRWLPGFGKPAKPRHITNFFGIHQPRSIDYKKQVKSGLGQRFYKLITRTKMTQQEMEILKCTAKCKRLTSLAENPLALKLNLAAEESVRSTSNKDMKLILKYLKDIDKRESRHLLSDVGTKLMQDNILAALSTSIQIDSLPAAIATTQKSYC